MRKSWRFWHRQNTVRGLTTSLAIFITVIWLLVLHRYYTTLYLHRTSTGMPQIGNNYFEDIAESHRVIYSNECVMSIIETVPEGNMYPHNVTFGSIKQVWNDLIERAQESIEICTFYTAMRLNSGFTHVSSLEGEKLFHKLAKTVKERNIQLKLVYSADFAGTKIINSTIEDTKDLAKMENVEIRALNLTRLYGGGILHSKFWIVDRKHLYIGTANFKWWSITHVKEIGTVVYNCPSLAKDLAKIFEVYWSMSTPEAVLPKTWPHELSTNINMHTPLSFADGHCNFRVYIASSPPQLNPEGRTSDDDAIVSLMDEAQEFIYIAVVGYSPMILHIRPLEYWGRLDGAIRAAALARGVRVRLLVAAWAHARRSQLHVLRALTALHRARPSVQVQAKIFKVPSTPEQGKIPNIRLAHHKYMVTDKAAYIGTSNWSGDYFTKSTGVAFVLQDGVNTSRSIRSDLKEVFERDWNSPYAYSLDQVELNTEDPLYDDVF